MRELLGAAIRNQVTVDLIKHGFDSVDLMTLLFVWSETKGVAIAEDAGMPKVWVKL